MGRPTLSRKRRFFLHTGRNQFCTPYRTRTSRTTTIAHPTVEDIATASQGFFTSHLHYIRHPRPCGFLLNAPGGASNYTVCAPLNARLDNLGVVRLFQRCSNLECDFLYMV